MQLFRRNPWAARTIVKVWAAILLCAPCHAGEEADERGPGNDSCSAATAISGAGVFSFGNLGSATTDGVSHPTECGVDITRDKWWRWTSPCDGVVTIETCSLSSANTVIAAYATLAPCAPTAQYLLACNNDACGLQSSVSFVAIAGQEYLLRIGLPSGVTTGTGSFRVSCAVNSVCSGEPSICQEVNLAGAPYASHRTARVADGFTVPASGYISALCWRGGATGSPPADAFRVIYRIDDSGKPGTSIADFSQALGTLLLRKIATGDTITGGRPEYEYSAAHASVPIAAGTPYWIEIYNDQGTTDTWVWAAGVGGDGVARRTSSANNWSGSSSIPDRALCLAYESSCLTDTNGDGVIDFADLNNILSFINTVCP